MSENTLIFDLGFHNGDDSDYYLHLGYTVIALEADHTLIEKGTERFKKYIDEGKLILLHKAISEKSGTCKFYIHPTKKDWSSCFINLAESDGSKATEVEIDAVTISDLFNEYGIPHYLKVDVEGCDLFVAKQLSELSDKPKYASFETSKRDYAGIFAYLYVAGYQRFQLVNQMNNAQKEIESIDLDGLTDSYTFGQYASGEFGQYLHNDKWLSYDDALLRYIKYKELKQIDNQELGLGWLDVHACLN